ncbi:hypothetical protein LJB83_02670, partial [Clostridia bacterium OttesenSCG-928-F22]|nr:hypothetical protein [Clostridia bacterium OttesenSCG-928-F22]
GEVTTGVYFNMHQPTGVMAVVDYTETESEIKLYHIANKQEVSIIKGGNGADIQWSKSGEVLYYTLADNTDEQYPYKIMAYDTKAQSAKELGRTLASQMFATGVETELLLQYMDYNETTGARTITYQFDTAVN